MAWKPSYDMTRNYISDLGAVRCGDACSPWHALMNISFVLQGLLIFFGGVLVRKLFPPRSAVTAALILIALSGVGVLLVGLAPEDVNPRLHYAAAAEHFLLSNAGMVVLALALLRNMPSRMYFGYTVVSGLTGMTATLFLSRNLLFELGPGSMERIASYPFPLWLSVTGLLLLRGNVVEQPRSGAVD